MLPLADEVYECPEYCAPRSRRGRARLYRFGMSVAFFKVFSSSELMRIFNARSHEPSKRPRPSLHAIRSGSQKTTPVASGCYVPEDSFDRCGGGEVVEVICSSRLEIRLALVELWMVREAVGGVRLPLR